jgi:hypothetical protein
VAKTTQPKPVLISVHLWPEMLDWLRQKKKSTGLPMKIIIDQALRDMAGMPPRKA